MTAVWIALGATLLLTAIGIWVGVRVQEGCVTSLLLGGSTFFVSAMILVPIGVSHAYAHHDERTVTCTVTDKDRGGDSGSYRVYTEQCGVLANRDSLWRGKWDSADMWVEIEPGHTYRFTLVGWRFGFLSMFPNILDVDLVEEN